MGKQQGFAEVVLNGETKLLRYDFNAMADLEDHFDKGIASIMSEGRMGFSTVRALYWAGLKWRDKGITIERAGNTLQQEIENGKDLTELMGPVVEAIQNAGWLKGNKANEETTGDEPKN